jgi:hypothetical protein
VVVVAAPAGRVRAASPDTATTAIADRRDSKREMCTGDPPRDQDGQKRNQRDQRLRAPGGFVHGQK